MADIRTALRNIKKGGVKAIVGAFKTPGGYLGRPLRAGEQGPNAPLWVNAPFGLKPTPSQQTLVSNYPGLSTLSSDTGRPKDTVQGIVSRKKINKKFIAAQRQAAEEAVAAMERERIMREEEAARRNTVASVPSSYASPVAAYEEPAVEEQIYVPQYIQLPNGQVFDVNDPAQREAFFIAKNALINAQIEEQYNLFNQQQDTALQEAARDYTRNLEATNYDLSQLGQEIEDYNRQNEQLIGDTRGSYGLGTARRQNLFAQASPLAYQSAQGTSQAYAQDQLNRALADVARATEQTRQNYTRQEGELTRQRGDLTTGYQGYLDRARQGLEQYRQALRDQAAGTRTELAGNLANLDVQQGINQFRYDKPTALPLEKIGVDLSPYSRYLNFSETQASPEYNYFNLFRPTIANRLTPTEQWLGYNPLERRKNPTLAYLGG